MGFYGEPPITSGSTSRVRSSCRGYHVKIEFSKLDFYVPCDRMLFYRAVNLPITRFTWHGQINCQIETMKKTEIAKIITLRSLIAVLCLALGILISIQVKSLPERATNPVAPYVSLKETKEELYEEQAQLKREIESLHKDIELAQAASEDSVLSPAEKVDLQDKKAKAGLAKLNGPGVIIVLNDSKSNIVSDETIVHASDLRDIVNLLWNAGAEAITINGQRVVQSTAIDCIVNTVLVNNIRLSTPFQIEAIGPKENLLSTLRDPGILSGVHDRKKNNGLVFEVSGNNDITVPIYNGSFDVSIGG